MLLINNDYEYKFKCDTIVQYHSNKHKELLNGRFNMFSPLEITTEGSSCLGKVYRTAINTEYDFESWDPKA